MNLLVPAEIADATIEAGYKKSMLPVYKMLLLGIMAGAFIAFGSQGSNMAKHAIDNVSAANVLSGTLFSAGLIMVVLGGAELFTGNTLMGVSCLAGRTQWSYMLKNWLFVYIGNFIGSVIIAYFVFKSGQLNASNSALGGYTIRVAIVKTSLSFTAAFFSGILCNWLVCMAVWMATGAKDVIGKLFSCFFPIWLFVLSGFEHSVANMYFVPAGIIAKANQAYVDAAVNSGISMERIANLSYETFFKNNLLPVTLGNIVGGFFFVGTMYFLIYKTPAPKPAEEKK